jgi:hypothetical protein
MCIVENQLTQQPLMYGSWHPLSRRSCTLLFAVGAFVTLMSPLISAQDVGATPRDLPGLESLVQDLKGRLSIAAPIAVSIVPVNALMMSVEAPASQQDAFQLTVDSGFLGRLTEQELEAALAHELGHVWVFTHHPYLQTEALANQIAMRAVRRETLVQVYEKVWKQGGTKGDVTRFLGSPPAEEQGLNPRTR